MDMQMGLEPEQLLYQLHEDVRGIKEDLGRLEKFITGNGDPTQGLLWMVREMRNLIDSLSRALTVHSENAYAHRRLEPQGFWQRIGFEAAKQAAALIITGTIFLLLLGFVTWIQQPK